MNEEIEENFSMDSKVEGKDGWVYVLENQAMPGLVKIGFSMKDPSIRAEELSNSTSVPLPYIVSYRALVVNPQTVEQAVHSVLDDKRLNDKREFFQCKLIDAIKAVRGYSVVKYEEFNEEFLQEDGTTIPSSTAAGVLNVKYPDGSRYAGESLNGLRHGYGSMTWSDGRKYIGEWARHRFDGYGSMTWSDGRKYIGEWKAGKRHGTGMQTTKDGEIWRGFWSEDKFLGQKDAG